MIIRIVNFALIFTLCTQLCVAQNHQSAPIEVENEPVVSVESLWQISNDAYINRDYVAAIEGYTQIMNEQGVSVELLYNLANAYYKNGELAKAILYYNRALKIDPTDSDTLHNLKNVAEQQTKDRIDEVPEFFISGWIRNLSGELPSNQWMFISLFCFVLMGVSLMIFLLATSISYKKIGFYVLVAMIPLFAFSTRFSIEQRAELLDQTQAIIMDNSLTVKSSPDSSSTDLFILHEGTKVSIGGKLGDWIEVTISDGKRGWIKQQSVEVI